MAAKKKTRKFPREGDPYKQIQRLKEVLRKVVDSEIKSIKSLELALRETEFAEEIIEIYAYPCHHFFKTVGKLERPKGKPAKGTRQR